MSDAATLPVQLNDLPSPPAVVLQLLASMEQEDIDIAQLAHKVAHDQALTAKTLRLANSSAYGLSVKVTTIQQAITILGFQTTRNLITAAALTGSFPARKCDGFDDQAFWRHAVATAVCARALARQLRVNQDLAFTAGLLHDIGRLVLVTLHPQRYAEVLAHQHATDALVLTAEQEVIGIDHVLAGEALARHWEFPEAIRNAIAQHHALEAGAGALARIVHVADAVAHGLDLSGLDNEAVPPLSLTAWTAIGLDEEGWMQVFRDTELQFEEMAAILAA